MKWDDTIRWWARRSEHAVVLPPHMLIHELTEWLDLHALGRWRYFDPLRVHGMSSPFGWTEKAKERSIIFKHEADLVLFRLAFSEELARKVDGVSVILPIIRRVMPQVIAADIIGVQPMTGPTAQVFTMRARFQDILDATREELRESRMPWWRRWPSRLRRKLRGLMRQASAALSPTSAGGLRGRWFRH